MFNKKVTKVTAQQKRIRIDVNKDTYIIPVDSLFYISKNKVKVEEYIFYFNGKEFNEFVSILGLKDLVVDSKEN